VIAIAMVLAACSKDAEPPAARSAAPAAPVPAAFGLYVLSLTWAPSFCCSHRDKQECAQLAGSFAATHLTLHGLWPNYNDDEAKGQRHPWPEFCGDFARCDRSHDQSCEPDPSTIPDEMRVLGPGYVADHDFLADHEWPKHGSCTGLSPAEYFHAALATMKALPGEGTPDALRDAIGQDLARSDLSRAFGVPLEAVLLGCDAQCGLTQISFCFAHDAHGLPTTPTACPANTTDSRYDNGCVTRSCTRITIGAADQCGRRKDHSHACNKPGQGPSCTGNDECVAAGYVRCAHSGCCTSQP
jgi:ribonuclease T2